jgi:hypothetical protein
VAPLHSLGLGFRVFLGFGFWVLGFGPFAAPLPFTGFGFEGCLLGSAHAEHLINLRLFFFLHILINLRLFMRVCVCVWEHLVNLTTNKTHDYTCQSSRSVRVRDCVRVCILCLCVCVRARTLWCWPSHRLALTHTHPITHTHADTHTPNTPTPILPTPIPPNTPTPIPFTSKLPYTHTPSHTHMQTPIPLIHTPHLAPDLSRGQDFSLVLRRACTTRNPSLQLRFRENTYRLGV